MRERRPSHRRRAVADGGRGEPAVWGKGAAREFAVPLSGIYDLAVKPYGFRA